MPWGRCGQGGGGGGKEEGGIGEATRLTHTSTLKKGYIEPYLNLGGCWQSYGSRLRRWRGEVRKGMGGEETWRRTLRSDGPENRDVFFLSSLFLFSITFFFFFFDGVLQGLVLTSSWDNAYVVAFPHQRRIAWSNNLQSIYPVTIFCNIVLFVYSDTYKYCVERRKPGMPASKRKAGQF